MKYYNPKNMEDGGYIYIGYGEVGTKIKFYLGSLSIAKFTYSGIDDRCKEILKEIIFVINIKAIFLNYLYITTKTKKINHSYKCIVKLFKYASHN